MDIKNLRNLIECAEGKIKSNPTVYAGCTESGILLGKVFDKLGIKWERKFGEVSTVEGKRVYHCWLEANDIVIETNPSQILGLPKGALAVHKDLWQKVTEPKEEIEIFPHAVEPTPAGHRFYDREAEQILQCYRGKV